MKMLIITHAEFEKPGYIETWANNNGYSTDEVKPYAGEKLPDITAYDFLVVMGGPQSPLEIEKAPYLYDEIDIIKQALKKKIPIIGVCLGAQLIGESLGAKTEHSPYREIGKYPINLLDASKSDPIFKQFPQKFDVMHWHSDMPGLTKDAALLASSLGCSRQIVRYDEKVYGFQCHLELTKDLVKNMIDKCPNDLIAGKYINTTEELMKVDYDEINTKLHAILNYMSGLESKYVCKDEIESKEERNWLLDK